MSGGGSWSSTDGPRTHGGCVGRVVWSEQVGITAYGRLRDGIRGYYRDNYPLMAGEPSAPDGAGCRSGNSG
jgi:hypothetical protein